MSTAINATDVLSEELAALSPTTECAPGETIERRLNRADLGALCLSGGGVRSASFGLGVVQALAQSTVSVDRVDGSPDTHVIVKKAATADESLLSRFQFLSTVSGGGYIGSFLSTWIAREGYKEVVWPSLSGRPSGPDMEPAPIDWLRDYSSYLTPRAGLASADTWTAVALFVRNMVLNWFVLVPMLLLAILAIYAFSFFVVWLGATPPNATWLATCLGGLGALCIVMAARYTTRHRPTRAPSGESVTTAAFLGRDLLPLLGGAFLLVLALITASGETILRDLSWSTTSVPFRSWPKVLSFVGSGAIAGATLYGLGWCLAWLELSREATGRSDNRLDLIRWMLSGAVSGSFAMLGAYLHLMNAETLSAFGPAFVALIAGVPWLLLGHLLGEMIFVGLTCYENDSDNDREWFARADGYVAVAAAVWLVSLSLVVYGFWLAHATLKIGKAVFASAAVFSSVATAILAWSRSTPGTAASGNSTARFFSAGTALAIAAPISAATLVIGFSILADWALFGSQSLVELARRFGMVNQQQDWPAWRVEHTTVLVAMAVVSVVGLLAGRYVNVNRFSLHALYRNRIIRAFLGASHVDSEPTRDRFTGFDANDNFRVYQLWPQEMGDDGSDASETNDSPESATSPTADENAAEPSAWMPFHIINMALNVVAGEKLAWQQRKAESFTVSPLHSGTSRLGYRRSNEYGDPNGITVGTAVAISGAAVSPNMGYHSSPPLAFLMTLFNVRLGWWLGNPGPAGDATYTREGPATAQLPLLEELFGSATNTRKYVYLSDGGHFENLGLYEMVRRRSRRIIISDAGCDPSFGFEDLGNAIRKISIDLGVEITFPLLDKMLSRAVPAPQKVAEAISWAIGTINYRDADGGGENGVILYLKPTFYPVAIDNVGVRNYGLSNTDFPHQSTAEQWFDEAQFESYRALGFEIALSAIRANASFFQSH